MTSYQIVIVSNQKQIAIQPKAPKKPSTTTNDSKIGDSKSLSNFKQRASAALSTLDLDVPLSVYAATENDEFRKPRMGMWREFLDDYDLDVAGVDLGRSFFVGDAAGRKGDHSQVDRCVSKYTYLYLICANESEDSRQTSEWPSKRPRNSSSMPPRLKNSRNRLIQIYTCTPGPASTNRILRCSHASIPSNSSFSAAVPELASPRSTGITWSRWGMNG